MRVMRKGNAGVMKESEEDEEEVDKEIGHEVHQEHKAKREGLNSTVDTIDDCNEADIAHDDEDTLRRSIDRRRR